MTIAVKKRNFPAFQRWEKIACMGGLVGLAVMVQLNGPTQAQAQEQEASVSFVGQPMTPVTMVTVEKAERRSIADMPSAAPDVSAGVMRQIPFLSDIPADTLKAMQEGTLAPQGGTRPLTGAQAPLAPPGIVSSNFNGVSQGVACPGCAPPDPHGAAGLSHFVQVTNSHVDIYTIAGVLVKSVTLNAFFGEADFLFDPRVVYDPIWNRWIIVATRRANSAADPVRKFRLAVSTTSNPTGSFFSYTVPFNIGIIQNGDFWDYPQLGFDQDAVVVTGNVFSSSSTYRTTAMVPLAKARLYNGLGTAAPLFTGLPATLAPPIVQDQNANAYFVAANNGAQLHLYRGTNLSNPANATLVLQALVAVSAYSAPPAAVQPGTAVKLDASDRRFVNASSQVGDSLWNVHAIPLGGFATPKFYQIDTEGAGANSIKQQGFFFAAGASHDWNASIAANAAGEAFVTWSSTNPGIGVNAQVRVSGRQPTDPLGVIGAGVVLFQSPGFYTMGLGAGTARWGDYSAVSLRPNAAGACAANRRAWATNQKNDGVFTWGTRIGQFGFC